MWDPTMASIDKNICPSCWYLIDKIVYPPEFLLLDNIAKIIYTADQ